jgi:hypothetical protein
MVPQCELAINHEDASGLELIRSLVPRVIQHSRLYLPEDHPVLEDRKLRMRLRTQIMVTGKSTSSCINSDLQTDVSVCYITRRGISSRRLARRLARDQDVRRSMSARPCCSPCCTRRCPHWPWCSAVTGDQRLRRFVFWVSEGSFRVVWFKRKSAVFRPWVYCRYHMSNAVCDRSAVLV